MSVKEKVETQEVCLNDIKNARLRHLVKKDENGNPLDKCLCGYIWDIYKPKPEGELCQECLEIYKKELGI